MRRRTILTLNEAKNLPHVLPRILGIVSEVVIVDGRSTDNTVGVAQRLLPDCVALDLSADGFEIETR